MNIASETSYFSRSSRKSISVDSTLSVGKKPDLAESVLCLGRPRRTGSSVRYLLGSPPHQAPRDSGIHRQLAVSLPSESDLEQLFNDIRRHDYHYSNYIWDREFSGMKSNTELHEVRGCPLSLHNSRVTPVATSAESCELRHTPVKITPASLFSLNQTRPRESERTQSHELHVKSPTFEVFAKQTGNVSRGLRSLAYLISKVISPCYRPGSQEPIRNSTRPSRVESNLREYSL